MTESYFFEFLLLIFFLFLSAFFSSSETSFMTVDKFWLDIKEMKGDKRASRVKNILKESSVFLTSILIGNNIVNVAVSAIGTDISLKIWPGDKGVIISTIWVTIILLLFSEITPKTIATAESEKLSLFLSKPVSIVIAVLSPIVWFINKFSSYLLSLLGVKSGSKLSLWSPGHFKFLLKVWEKRGIITPDEENMVQGLFSLKTLAVEHVMIPRGDVISIEDGDSIDDILKIALSSHYSRFPVLSSGTVKGLIHVKDILKYYREQEKFELKKIIRKTSFVHQEKNLWNLFQELLSTKNELVIVVNEYGDFLGIVTFEDILEEVVGDIYDEYDSINSGEIKKINDDIYEVDGRITLHKLEELFNIELPKDKGKILSEYLFSLKEKQLIEKELLDDELLEFKVLKMKKLFPAKVRVKIKHRD